MQLINELECFKRGILVTNFLILAHKNLIAHEKNSNVLNNEIKITVVILIRFRCHLKCQVAFNIYTYTYPCKTTVVEAYCRQLLVDGENFNPSIFLKIKLEKVHPLKKVCYIIYFCFYILIKKKNKRAHRPRVHVSSTPLKNPHLS